MARMTKKNCQFSCIYVGSRIHGCDRTLAGNSAEKEEGGGVAAGNDQCSSALR